MDGLVVYFCAANVSTSYWLGATIDYAPGFCGGEFRQETAVLVCLCSTVAGTSEGRLKKWR